MRDTVAKIGNEPETERKREKTGTAVSGAPRERPGKRSPATEKERICQGKDGYMGMMRKIIVWLLIAVLAVGLVVLFAFHIRTQNEKDAVREEMNREMEPLLREQANLRGEYSALEKSYARATKGIGTFQLLAPVPLDWIYEDVCKLLPEYPGMIAVVGISATSRPGGEGMCTAAQAAEMAQAGWAFCYTFCREEMEAFGYDASAMADWLGSVRAVAEEMDLSLQPAVYFPAGEYREEYGAWLTAAGIRVAVHHGESSRNLVTTEPEGDLWCVGAIPWNISGSSTRLNTAISGGGNIVYTVGADSAEENYIERNFRNMLQYVTRQTESGGLAVTDMAEMLVRQTEPQDTELLREYETRMAQIEARLADIDREIDAIGERYAPSLA